MNLLTDGETPTLATLHSPEYIEEYKNLDQAELAEITAAHESTALERFKRPTSKARAQDVSVTLETVRNMVSLFFSIQEYTHWGCSSSLSTCGLASRHSSVWSVTHQNML